MTNKLSQKQIRSIALALVSLLLIAGITFTATAQGDDSLIRRILSTLTDHQLSLAQLKRAGDELKKEVADPQHGLKKLKDGVQTVQDQQTKLKEVADEVKKEVADPQHGLEKLKDRVQTVQDQQTKLKEVTDELKKEVVDPRHGLKQIEEGVQTV